MSALFSKRPARAQLVLLAVLACAFALRAWNSTQLGIDHYDEGVYASSAIGIADPTQPFQLFPGEFRFSPPVYFSLLGAWARCFGMETDAAAIALNIALGTLTVLAVGWIGRRWFGAPAGLAAAALVAFDEYHVALSRTGLTDVAFSLFFMIALFALVEALERRSALLCVLAGLAVGVAWNTKYHGWLALAMVGVGMLPSLWESLRRRNRDGLTLLALWSLSALVAGLCYVPWALYVDGQPGGYRGLIEYQQTMLRNAWFDNLLRQGLYQLYLEGPFARAGVVAALLAAILAARRAFPLSRAVVVLTVLLASSALVLGIAVTTALLAVLALPRLLGSERNLRTTLLVVWMIVWFLLTPVYHPYARLVLPLTIAASLAAGAWIGRRVERLATQQDAESGAHPPAPRGALVAAFAVIAVGAASLALPDPSDPWGPRRDHQRAAAAMVERIPLGSRVIVLGEPSLAYYLHRSGRPAFENVSGRELGPVLEAAKDPVFVVTGIYAARSGAAAEHTARLGERMTLVDTQPFEPSEIRLLDDFSPRRALKFHAQPTAEYELRLYRYSPR